MEKFEKYFGDIKVKEHSECELYKTHLHIWETHNYKLNSIFCFLEEILSKSHNTDVNINYGDSLNAIKCKPSEYIKTFNKWIGDVNDIKDNKYRGLHEIIERDLLEVYYQTYPAIKLNQKLKKVKVV